MCAGCPGGGTVSNATAYINLNGLKPAVLGELRRRVGCRATVTVLGDRWVLGSRTGVQHVLPDIEALARALIDKKFLERLPSVNDGADLDRFLNEGVCFGDPLAAAERFVQAMLARAAHDHAQ